MGPCAIIAGRDLLCYNTAWIRTSLAMHDLRPAETLNWSAVHRLVIAGLGLVLLWGAVWWAIQ
jgi:hypothetical protein